MIKKVKDRQSYLEDPTVLDTLKDIQHQLELLDQKEERTESKLHLQLPVSTSNKNGRR